MSAMIIKLAEARARRAKSERPGVAPDLLLAGSLLWLTSVARVVAAILTHETFEAEATVALACALALPWLLVAPILGRRARARADRRVHDGAPRR